eukprot:CAMPEP_0198326278 /NCGR_PEP_ID=MMETSP1450-20131203/13846_1 /TAXON_ID=753684 ORGANISM="Madagascaria erythrocladiodes, Strain CCMP3234" /NCGR_SAMPLE_ID=MMETSP1450 /ASSEMBLY_ACC=CAM_ASM_001115 /LENGTH=571 /DNA_ID=CAMNT_0044030233 /DNA_START=34 /DNA_END=1749 /DNA_ORIENTATION=+
MALMLHRVAIVLVGACVAAAAARAGANRHNAEVVNTTTGAVRGVATRTYRKFLGVPYARPPVGAYRWRAPLPHAPWAETRDATTFAAGCPQNCHLPPHTCPDTQSEDCLTLNVYTPLRVGDNDTQLLPVLVFLPGGNFRFGTAHTLLYDGGLLARRGRVLVVVANYRLGFLGQLYDDSAADASVHAYGNYAIRDQQAVLAWVQANAARFGGDARRVTLSGQSAGATSTGIHLVAPSSRGLFHQAVMFSNPWTLPLKTVPEQRTLTARFTRDAGCHSGGHNAKKLGVDGTACLRQVDVATLLRAQNTTTHHFSLLHPLFAFMPVVPTIGGADELIADAPSTLIEAGAALAVPTLAGGVSNETLFFVYQAFKKLPEAELIALVLDVFGIVKGTELLEMYRVKDWAHDTKVALSAMTTDWMFTCIAQRLSAALAPHQRRQYYYFFEQVLSFGKSAWGEYTYCANRVCHGNDLPFWFMNDFILAIEKYTAAEVQLGYTMGDFLTAFVRNADPNDRSGTATAAAAAPAWPAYTNSSRSLMHLLAADVHAVPDGRNEFDGKPHHCDFFQALYDKARA